MSLALEISEQTYAGNASTTTPYPVTFPILDIHDVAVSVRLANGNVSQLSAADFEVHSLGSGNYTITTSVAWPASATLIIYRSLPFDQPFEFPESSIIRTTEIERAFDRVVMQVQQLYRLLLTHNHDDRYYTKAVLDARYYTRTEILGLFYTQDQINALIASLVGVIPPAPRFTGDSILIFSDSTAYRADLN